MRPLFLQTVALGILVIPSLAPAHAQPPEGRDGFRPPMDHLREALDSDHDGELSADEIKNAPASLAKLDRNSDGRIDREEFRPPPPPRGRPGEPPREGGPDRPPFSEGPPRDGQEPREGRPGAFGPPPGGGSGGFQGPPSPERFIERAMSFDADGDGKLNRDELAKFAAEVMTRFRSGEGRPGAGDERRGPPNPTRGDQPRGEGFRPSREPGEQSDRPRRPE